MPINLILAIIMLIGFILALFASLWLNRKFNLNYPFWIMAIVALLGNYILAIFCVVYGLTKKP